MTYKINRLLIPLVILIFLNLVKLNTANGQTQTYNSYIPIIGYQPTGWIGPYSGTIISIVFDPSNPQVVYAGTFGSGVFKSMDGGIDWLSVNHGLSNLEVYSLAIDPTKPSVLYAGTYQSQVYKSTNGGETWTWSGNGMQPSAIVYSLAVDPVTPSIIYASTRGISNNGSAPWSGILYKSSDAGQTWTPSLWNVGGVDLQDWEYSVVVNPNEHEQVFAAAHQNGPYRSDDSGSTWHSIHSGITDPSGRAITVSPQLAYSSTLYYGVWHFATIFKSINSGNLWTNVAHDISYVEVYSLAIDPFSVNTVYVGSFSNGCLKTTDGGLSWENAGLQTDQIYTIKINPSHNNILLAGTAGDGLYRSIDSSTTWQRSNAGLSTANVTAVVHPNSNPYSLYASVYGSGVYQTGDRGQTWEDLNQGLGDKLVHELVMDPVNHNLLYALTDTGGLYQNNLSTGNGWVSYGQGLPLTTTSIPAYPADHPFATLDMQEAFANPPVSQNAIQATNAILLNMEFAPSNPQIVYMGTGGSGIYRSTNSGINWQSDGLDGQTIYSLAIDSADSNLVYAATSDIGNMKVSQDGGASWNNVPSSQEIFSLAASPNATGVVYAGTNNGIYRYQSSDWSQLGLSGQSVTVIAFDPKLKGVLYAGTTSGAYYSVDNGKTWKFVDPRLTGHTIQSISFDQSNSNMVYFGTKENGILLVAIQF